MFTVKYEAGSHCVSHKTALFIVTKVRTSDLNFMGFFYIFRQQMRRQIFCTKC
jgi:hypothetical protein